MNPRQTRTDSKQGGKTLFVIVWAPADTWGQFGLGDGAESCLRQVTKVRRVGTAAPLSLGVPQPRWEPRAVPEAGPSGTAAPRAPAQLLLNGAAVEKLLPAAAGAAAWPGAGPGAGGFAGLHKAPIIQG